MLEEVKKNIERLISLYEKEREKNSALSVELEACKAENVSQREKIAELERRVDNLGLSNAFSAQAGNSHEAKERINELIRDIDKCISLLEK